jgi:homoserine O-succinyltransferase/O-acetyltransferase
MPIVIEGTPVPTRWIEHQRLRRVIPTDRHDTRREGIKIAFINNMPDAALEDTELQFFQLLEGAATGIVVRLKLFSLPGIPRGERGEQHLATFYCGIENLWTGRFDAVIMTGTEPLRSDLRDEPYWRVLTDVLQWAERCTSSTVLSCLAAHAGVLYSDGITRRPLTDKRFGVFECRRTGDHPLTAFIEDPMRFPHSRWNEVQEADLTSCGYTALTRSPEAGVDLFVKKKANSLFVHFQGHPEYEAHTLLKEYRRDVRRFLHHERETYPSIPRGYFDAAGAEVLAAFREKALSDRDPEHFAAFPAGEISSSLQKTWHFSALSIYCNWLQYVATRKSEQARVLVRSAIRSRPHNGSSAVL